MTSVQTESATAPTARTPSPSIVRLADGSEMEDLLALMKEAAEEQALFPVDDDRARALLNRAFLRQGGIVGVIGEKGAIEASVYLMLAQPVYSSSWHIEEVWNVVRPAFRRSTHAKSLLEFAKRCHHDIGIPVLVGVLHREKTEAKLRLYRRQFGPAVGGYFLYGHPGYGLTPPK
jgi:GNAT superfamily N-acetyltransferase